jgi:hypothetical protein
MARVRDGCATLQRAAALVKFSVSLTAKKYRIWCISIRVAFAYPTHIAQRDLD